jgi:hypothetical protein
MSWRRRRGAEANDGRAARGIRFLAGGLWPAALLGCGADKPAAPATTPIPSPIGYWDGQSIGQPNQVTIGFQLWITTHNGVTVTGNCNVFVSNTIRGCTASGIITDSKVDLTLDPINGSYRGDRSPRPTDSLTGDLQFDFFATRYSRTVSISRSDTVRIPQGTPPP